jgi:polar amino acid transport system substrate-binding protein
MGPMRRIRLAAVSACIAASCVLAAGAARAQAITFTTEYSFPDVMLVDGKISGYATEKVREIMRRTAIDFTITMLPWKRAYTLAQTDVHTCVFTTSRTPERENLFQWVGPVGVADWVLFGRADRTYNIKSLGDASSLRIGGYNGDVRGLYLLEKGMHVDFVSNDASNPKKLMMGRIDLWAGSPISAQAVLAELGLTGKIVPVLTFNNVKFYVACNLAMAAGQVGRMSAALREMEADGTSRAIEQRFEHLPVPARRGIP